MEKRLHEQEAKQKWNEEQDNAKAEAEAAGEEGWERKEYEGQLVEVKPFLTQKVQYVVCLNTLG